MNEKLAGTLEEAFDWWCSVSLLPAVDFIKLVNKNDDELLLILKYVQVFYNKGYLDGARFMSETAINHRDGES